MNTEQDDKISQTESTSSILNASIAKVTYYTITNTIPSIFHWQKLHSVILKLTLLHLLKPRPFIDVIFSKSNSNKCTVYA